MHTEYNRQLLLILIQATLYTSETRRRRHKRVSNYIDILMCTRTRSFKRHPCNYYQFRIFHFEYILNHI